MATQLKYEGKFVIFAELKCVTGLHIGGREEEFEIGGNDNPVIKDPITGQPYIPGSSLKGKLRSLLEWATGRVKITSSREGTLVGKICDCGKCDVCVVFGCPAEYKEKEPTRLTVRDAFLSTASLKQMERILGLNIFTEIKTENALDRLTSAANPRPLERVPAGSIFNLELIYDVYSPEDRKRLRGVFEAMSLLEDSALGGGGSRGSGKVLFTAIKIYERGLAYYQQGKQQERLLNKEQTSVSTILRDFNQIVEE